METRTLEAIKQEWGNLHAALGSAYRQQMNLPKQMDELMRRMDALEDELARLTHEQAALDKAAKESASAQ